MSAVNFAVYFDEAVPGWPANYRRIVRCGFLADTDVPGQAIDPLDVAFATAATVDLTRDAVALDPEPTIVPMPD